MLRNGSVGTKNLVVFVCSFDVSLSVYLFVYLMSVYLFVYLVFVCVFVHLSLLKHVIYSHL